MGVPKLLDFVRPAMHTVRLSDYKGQTLAVDASCWLHRGVYACPLELARGEHTEQFLSVAKKFLDAFAQHGVKPLLVFDGAAVAMKARLNDQRRVEREAYARKAHALLAEGKESDARTAMSKGVRITTQMTQQFIALLRRRGVAFVVAPYEADAQLAYLVEHNYCAAAVTEDSDLLAYGCRRTLFKLDYHGEAQLISLDDLQHLEAEGKHLFAGTWPGEAEAWRAGLFTDMCILAGTDYLPSAPQVGIKRAHQALRAQRDVPRDEATRKAATQLHAIGAKSRGGSGADSEHRASLELENYLALVRRVQQVFHHQRVYDPATGRVVPLRPAPAGVSLLDENVGPAIDPQTARLVCHEAALDPRTMRPHAPDSLEDAPIPPAPVAAPLPRGASPPAAAAAAPPPDASSPGVATIEIVVPPNASPGRSVKCNLPNGMSHMGVLPAGATPGSKVRFTLRMTSGGPVEVADPLLVFEDDLGEGLAEEKAAASSSAAAAPAPSSSDATEPEREAEAEVESETETEAEAEARAEREAAQAAEEEARQRARGYLAVAEYLACSVVCGQELFALCAPGTTAAAAMADAPVGGVGAGVGSSVGGVGGGAESGGGATSPTSVLHVAEEEALRAGNVHGACTPSARAWLLHFALECHVGVTEKRLWRRAAAATAAAAASAGASESMPASESIDGAGAGAGAGGGGGGGGGVIECQVEERIAIGDRNADVVRVGQAYAALLEPLASAGSHGGHGGDPWPAAAREALELFALSGWRQAVLAPLRKPTPDWRRFRALLRRLPPQPLASLLPELTQLCSTAASSSASASSSTTGGAMGGLGGGESNAAAASLSGLLARARQCEAECEAGTAGSLLMRLSSYSSAHPFGRHRDATRRLLAVARPLLPPPALRAERAPPLPWPPQPPPKEPPKEPARPHQSPSQQPRQQRVTPSKRSAPSEPEPEPELASGLAAVVSTDRCVVMIEEDVQLKAYNPYDDLLG